MVDDAATTTTAAVFIDVAGEAVGRMSRMSCDLRAGRGLVFLITPDVGCWPVVVAATTDTCALRTCAYMLVCRQRPRMEKFNNLMTLSCADRRKAHLSKQRATRRARDFLLRVRFPAGLVSALSSDSARFVGVAYRQCNAGIARAYAYKVSSFARARRARDVSFV